MSLLIECNIEYTCCHNRLFLLKALVMGFLLSMSVYHLKIEYKKLDCWRDCVSVRWLWTTLWLAWLMLSLVCALLSKTYLQNHLQLLLVGVLSVIFTVVIQSNIDSTGCSALSSPHLLLHFWSQPKWTGYVNFTKTDSLICIHVQMHGRIVCSVQLLKIRFFLKDTYKLVMSLRYKESIFLIWVVCWPCAWPETGHCRCGQVTPFPSVVHKYINPIIVWLEYVYFLG